MGYAVHEVDPHGSAEAIQYFNSLSDLFPPLQLQPRHLNDGYWWMVFNGPGHIVGFAGMVPFEPGWPNRLDATLWGLTRLSKVITQIPMSAFGLFGGSASAMRRSRSCTM